MTDKELIINNLNKLFRYLVQMENFYPVELEGLGNSYLEDLAFTIQKLTVILNEDGWRKNEQSMLIGLQEARALLDAAIENKEG